MGIDGLHPVLRPYLTTIDLSVYAGKRVGCDASAWLHRGAVGCAMELAQGTKPWLDRGAQPPYVEFCLRMLDMLRSKGVKPVVVFDGGALPAKLMTHKQRRARRAEKLEKASMLLAEGNMVAASSAFCATIDVTCEMAHELMAALRRSGIDFIVAPYEADSQLAFLTQVPASNGGIAAVITEDSDMVSYGCPYVIFKADRSGIGQQLALADLFGAPPTTDQKAVEGPSSGSGSGSGRLSGGGSSGKPASFRRFTLEMLQTVCVLAGCDFLPSIKGVGVKKALELVRKYRSLARVMQVLRLNPKMQVPAGYPEAAQKALWNFRHALVFDAAEGGGQQSRLNPLPAELKDADADVSFLGPPLPEGVAKGIASGKLQPHPPYKPHAQALPKNAAGPTVLSGGSSWLASASRRAPDLIATAAAKAAAAPFKPPQAAGFSQAIKRSPLSPVNNRPRHIHQSSTNNSSGGPAASLPSQQGALLSALHSHKCQQPSQPPCLQRLHSNSPMNCTGSAVEKGPVPSQHSFLPGADSQQESQISQQTPAFLSLSKQPACASEDLSQPHAGPVYKPCVKQPEAGLQMGHLHSEGKADIDASPCTEIAHISAQHNARNLCGTACAPASDPADSSLVSHSQLLSNRKAQARLLCKAEQQPDGQQQGRCTQQGADASCEALPQPFAKRRRLSGPTSPPPLAKTDTGFRDGTKTDGNEPAGLENIPPSSLQKGEEEMKQASGGLLLSPSACAHLVRIGEGNAIQAAEAWDPADENSIPETPLPGTGKGPPLALAADAQPSHQRSISSKLLLQGPAADMGASTSADNNRSRMLAPDSHPLHLCLQHDCSSEPVHSKISRACHDDPAAVRLPATLGAQAASTKPSEPPEPPDACPDGLVAEQMLAPGCNGSHASRAEVAAVAVEPDSPRSGWSCPACTLLNVHGAWMCEACGQHHNASQRAPPGSASCVASVQAAVAPTAQRAAPGHRASLGSTQSGPSTAKRKGKQRRSSAAGQHAITSFLRQLSPRLQ
ncbi:hypothetical protein WJX74_006830 [Apatococcus lobatus]|uniref:Exonuclease 1 n=1 Tax=Apatococcus lobatus TaxID=904363 RepID=A0AAW1Q5T1_9CHLO